MDEKLPGVSNMKTQNEIDVDSFCRECYRQAVFTAVFTFIKGYGELIFGSLEFVPKFLGACSGVDDEQYVKVGNRRLFFLRHVIDNVSEALDMYRQATQTGLIRLPWQKDDPPINMMPYAPAQDIAADDIGTVGNGEGAELRGGFSLVYFPRLEDPFYVDNPPFRRSTFRGALASHVMLNGRNRDLEKFLGDKAISKWIEDRLMFPLNENLEYLCSFSCIFPNPYYCRSHMRLVPQSSGRKDCVRVVFDRDCSSQGLTLQLEERVSLNLGPVRLLPIDNRIIEVELTGCSDEVGYKVLDRNGRILECQDFAPFLRGINVEFFLSKPRKSKKDLGDGKALLSDNGIQIPGRLKKDGDIPELKLQHKRAVFRFARDAREKARFQYLYYAQREAAERKIWGIFLSARKTLTIVDPYFSEASIEDFIEDLDDSIKISVYCSSGALKVKNSNESGKRLHKKVMGLVAQGKKIEVEVVGHDHIHDRFIIVDGHESWLLGSSVATLGGSLSAIIKLENGNEVSSKLLSYLKAIFGKQSLEDWLKKSDADRAKHWYDLIIKFVSQVFRKCKP